MSVARAARRVALAGRQLGWVAAGCALAAACVTDHDALAKRDWDAGGSGAAGGAGGGGSGGTAGANDASVDAPLEPAGSYQFRLLNGAVDAESVALCFRVVVGTGSSVWVGAPTPSAGLPYGAHLDLKGLPWAPETDGLQPVVFTGELARIAGLDCGSALSLALSLSEQDAGAADASTDASTDAAFDSGGPDGSGSMDSGGSDSSADAAGQDAAGPDGGVPDAALDSGGADGGPLDSGAADGEPPDSGGPTDASAGDGSTPLPLPPALRVRELPLIPAGSLRDDRSYLLVLTGCFGGPSFTHASETRACGNAYSATTPTLGVLLVELSRITEPLVMGTQFLNASVASGELDLTSAPGEGAVGSPISIAARVKYGRIAPRPPELGYPAPSYGLPLDRAELSLFSSGATTAGVVSSWQAALPAGVELTNQHNYTVIAIGPVPGFDQAGFWQPARIVALPNDP